MTAPASLRFEDLSWRPRFGCKGPAAELWLAHSGYRAPAAPNSALLDADGVLVARLASSEFLIEAVDADFERVAATQAQLLQRAAPKGVYPILRQDLAVAIEGEGLNALLRQICSVDFEPLWPASAGDGGVVILTSMLGVSVIAWPQRRPSGAALMLWCDPSFAHYFWSTLLGLARGSGTVAISPSADRSGT